MTSKYLERFARITADDLPLRGNRLLVELLPKEEMKSAGGLILGSDMTDHRTSTDENRAALAIVLAVGNGYIDEEGQPEDIGIPVGSVILVSKMGLKLYSQFPGLLEYTKETIALTRDSEVHASWANLDAYKAYSKKLNA